jgi:porphobilinogen synthase
MAEEKYWMNQRRLRASAHIRDLSADVTLSHKEFIQPIFVDESLSERKEIRFLTGVFSETLDSILTQTASDIENGVTKFLLFPVLAHKVTSHFDFSFATHVVETLKSKFGSSIWLACDLCLCSYTVHGHCGLLNIEGTKLLNHETVAVLAEYALQLAKVGADCIAPSDMTDGRIKAIRQSLDSNGFDEVAIMSYSSKFNSSFYGPFRDICKSTPSSAISLTGRSTYQIDYRNLKDALASSIRDVNEGADFIMVKPCLPYLDVVKELSTLNVPLVVYQVSGEYAAIELLVENGLTQRESAHIETWISAKRAGANAIISYASRFVQKWMK